MKYFTAWRHPVFSLYFALKSLCYRSSGRLRSGIKHLWHRGKSTCNFNYFLFFAKFLSPLEDVFITAGMIIVRFCKPTNSNKIAFVLFAVKLHDIPYLQMLPRFKASATFPLTDGSSLLYRLKFEGWLTKAGKFSRFFFVFLPAPCIVFLCSGWLL